MGGTRELVLEVDAGQASPGGVGRSGTPCHVETVTPTGRRTLAGRGLVPQRFTVPSGCKSVRVVSQRGTGAVGLKEGAGRADLPLGAVALALEPPSAAPWPPAPQALVQSPGPSASRWHAQRVPWRSPRLAECHSPTGGVCIPRVTLPVPSPTRRGRPRPHLPPPAVHGVRTLESHSSVSLCVTHTPRI